MKPFKNQRGVIDVVLILVIAVAIAAFGGYVYYQQQQANKTYNTAGSGATVAKHAKKPVPVVDPTANWTAFSSVSGKFSLKYPPAWSKVVCDNRDDTLYLGPNPKAVAVCNAGFTGQVLIYSQAGDQSATYAFSKTDYSSITSMAVTVVGVTGTKQTATSLGNGVNVAAGVKTTRYVFVQSGRTVAADYNFDASNKSEEDVLADFDTMITKTLKFN